MKEGWTRWSCIQKVHGSKRSVRPTAILASSPRDQRRYLTIGTNILVEYFMLRAYNYDVEVVEDMTALEPQCYIMMTLLS